MTIKGAIQLLSRETMQQREEYYSDVVNYETGKLDKMIKLWNERDQTSDKRHWTLESNFNHATRVKNTITIKTLTWLKGAELYFDTKLEQASLKLEKFGFLDNDISMDISHAEMEYERGLNFHIDGFSRKDRKVIGRVKARLVWVECYEKQSHYRWIVTFKKS
tara:strand:- start:105 stop:593 length:489 start_codon:yes stop_codon:yes gene_type:complete